MYEEIFNAAGLSLKQAEIYQIILENGEMPAGKIDKKTPYKRSLVYKTLDELIEKGLILKLDAPGKVAAFRAEHPIKIKEMLEKKVESLNYYKKSVDEVLPQLISSYNLTLNKPGIKFFEGEDGVIKVLEDTLSSQTDVYLFMNNDALSGEEKYREINKEYVSKRQRAGVKKKIIEAGKKPELTFGTSDDKYDAITEIRYIPEEIALFKAAIQIYDGKISYQLFDNGHIISILIQDRNIYEMHRAWFEHNWNKLEE